MFFSAKVHPGRGQGSRANARENGGIYFWRSLDPFNPGKKGDSTPIPSKLSPRSSGAIAGIGVVLLSPIIASTIATCNQEVRA